MPCHVYVVLISLKLKDFCEVMEMNMQDRHGRVIKFRDIVHSMVLAGNEPAHKIYIVLTILICLVFVVFQRRD